MREILSFYFSFAKSPQAIVRSPQEESYQVKA